MSRTGSSRSPSLPSTAAGWSGTATCAGWSRCSTSVAFSSGTIATAISTTPGDRRVRRRPGRAQHGVQSMTPKDKPSAEPRKEPFRFAIPGPAILEPHASLRYVGKLFKALAVGLFLLLVAEITLGVMQDGVQALPLLLLEVAQ